MSRITEKYTDGTPFIPNGALQTIGMDGIAKKLAKYEDADEQGSLFMSPCKIDDIIYYVDKFRKKIYPIIAQNEWKIIDGKLHIFCESGTYANFICKDDIGNTAFLTQTEAEKALAKLKEEI